MDLDLSSAANWSLIYDATLSGSNLSKFLIPSSFSNQIIAVHISTQSPKPTWFTGGWINQIVQTNLVNDSTIWNSFSQRLYLGGNIIIFPTNFASYQLQFSFPAWFSSASLSIWSYTA